MLFIIERVQCGVRIYRFKLHRVIEGSFIALKLREITTNSKKAAATSWVWNVKEIKAKTQMWNWIGFNH